MSRFYGSLCIVVGQLITGVQLCT